MKEANIIGLDLAKRSFQAHGTLADGSVAFRKKLTRETFRLSCRAATLRRRHGGLRERPSLGSGYPRRRA